MGQKDLSEKNLEFFPDVFADIVNALLYEGEAVLMPEALKPAPTESLYRGKSGKLRNQLNDVSKYQMRNGKVYLQYTLENETKAGKRMIFRQAGYEGAIYREQLDSREPHPFVGLVLYWGERRWTKPRSIPEYFAKRDIPLETWKYINHYHMPVFQMARLSAEVRSHFHSDMRIIVDCLAEGENYVPGDRPVRHVEAVLLLLGNLLNNDTYAAIIPRLKEREEKEEVLTVRTLFDVYREDGTSKLLVTNVENLIRNCAMTLEQACTGIGSSVEEYQKAKEYLAQRGV